MLLLIISLLFPIFICNMNSIMPNQVSIEQEILHAWQETYTSEINASITRECMTANAIDNTVIPLRITEVGLYCLTESLIPNRALDFVISIETDNVVVDLNENFIQGIGVGNAIRANNRTNVIIRGGTIRQFGGNGITVTNGRGILLDTLTITNCNNGIFINSLTESVLQNCALYNNNAGLNINLGQFLLLTMCVASRNGQGIIFTNSANVILQQCYANNNAAQGFFNSAGKTFQYISCTANGNNHGFVMERTAKDSFAACSSTDNRNCGFDLNGDSISMITINAKGNNIGFNIRGTNNVINQCLAETNVTSGFLLTAASNFSLLRENIAMENGIGFNNLGTNNKLYSNFALNNTTNYVNVPNVFVSPTALSPINFTANIEN